MSHTVPLRRRWTLPLFVLLASTLAALAAAESSLRLFGYAGMIVFTPHPSWGYLMTPSQRVPVYGHPVVINALGLRGPEVRTPKPPGSTRILFIGDSVTYGGGRIREEQLFCRLVESSAQRDGVDAEAVNLAAPAWSPQNWSRYVEANGLHEADIIVLVLPECDLARPFATIASGGHRVEAPLLRLGSLVVKVQDVLAIRAGVVQARSAAAAEGDRTSESVRRAALTNVAAVRRLRELAGTKPFLTVLIPSGLPDYERFWPLFESELTEVLDLRGDLQDPGMFLDGVHLNVRGHQRVGERLYARLRGALTDLSRHAHRAASEGE